MATYEVKVMMEYWVIVEADSKKEAEDAGYMEYDEWMHTGTLYSSEAFLMEEDEEDSSSEEESE